GGPPVPAGAGQAQLGRRRAARCGRYARRGVLCPTDGAAGRSHVVGGRCCAGRVAAVTGPPPDRSTRPNKPRTWRCSPEQPADFVHTFTSVTVKASHLLSPGALLPTAPGHAFCEGRTWHGQAMESNLPSLPVTVQIGRAHV